MALKFYFDTHIAKAAAVQLRARGIEIVRCEEVEMAKALDEEHLTYATENGFIMVSQDEDFPILDAKWRESERIHTGIIKVPPDVQGSALISLVVKELSFYHEAEAAGAMDYETEIRNTLIYL